MECPYNEVVSLYDFEGQLIAAAIKLPWQGQHKLTCRTGNCIWVPRQLLQRASGQ